MAWECTINGRSSIASTPEELHSSLEQARAQQFLEVWLERDDGDGMDHVSMALLASSDRAWLMHLRHHEGDSGFSSRDPEYVGPGDGHDLLPFMLSNGQEDEYPMAWMIATNEACRALEHFMITGERPVGRVARGLTDGTLTAFINSGRARATKGLGQLGIEADGSVGRRRTAPGRWWRSTTVGSRNCAKPRRPEPATGTPPR